MSLTRSVVICLLSQQSSSVFVVTAAAWPRHTAAVNPGQLIPGGIMGGGGGRLHTQSMKKSHHENDTLC